MTLASRTAGRTPATILGVLAVAFWSASVGLNRLLTEAFGVVTASAAVYLLAGAVGCGALAATGGLRRALGLPPRVLLGQGALFVAYLVSFSFAVGFSEGKAQLIEIGVINYLWPGLTLVLSVPLLGNRARWTLPLGIAVSLLGVLAVGAAGAPWQDAGLLGGLTGRVADNPLPYALCLVNVLAWSLYSNLARVQASPGGPGATPVYLLVAGIGLALVRLLRPEPYLISAVPVAALLAMAVFPALLSYWFWERAMREGNMVLVASLAYLVPLFSTIITSLLQDVPLTPAVWLGCGLLIAGSWLCRRSVLEPLRAADGEPPPA
jgi:drug/metabolite transporter (DMT)-like permease